MEKNSPQHNNPESKIQIVYPEGDQARIQLEQILEETKGDLQNAMTKLQKDIKVLKDIKHSKTEYAEGASLDLKEGIQNEESFNQRIFEIRQLIKRTHEFMTELQLDTMVLEDEIKSIDETEKKLRYNFLHKEKELEGDILSVHKERLN